MKIYQAISDHIYVTTNTNYNNKLGLLLTQKNTQMKRANHIYLHIPPFSESCIIIYALRIMHRSVCDVQLPCSNNVERM